MTTGTTSSIWEGAATFRRGTAEKASFIFLCQLDLVLTLLAIFLGLTELNPLMRYMVGIPVLLLIVKLVIPMLIAWAIPGKLLLPSIMLLALAAIWNIKELIVFFC